jgi:hypothetical protein
LCIAFTSCKEDSTERGLEYPELLTAVYKTNNDYFDFVNTWRGFAGAPSRLSSGDSSKILITEEDTVYLLRWKLNDGYVMDLVITEDDYFTDMTFKELVAKNDACNGCVTTEDIFDRVVDKNPFREFYIDTDTLFRNRDQYDIQRLNEIIGNGELDNFLLQLK